MTDPKPFQIATVNAVMKAFGSRRKFRRFLVADEVGLGKTIVAQQVILRMMDRIDRPLTVFYMCSNLSIAKQNRDSLLKILPKTERVSAHCPVDRLSMMREEQKPTHDRLHLYSLTPDTSIPIRKKQRRDGRQEERALVHALIERIWPQFFDEWDHDVFQRSAGVNWQHNVERQESQVTSTILRHAFAESVKKEFGLEPNKQLVPLLRQFRDEGRELDLIAHMRNALAASAIEQLSPDLVIFDEFQKFRDLLNPKLDASERRVIGRLRGDDVDDPPALLMLSATPYQLFSRRWEDESGASHRRQFFELIEFLHGGDAASRTRRSKAELAFQELEGELRKGQTKSDAAKEARASIERLLRPIMSRTERASHDDGWAELKTAQLASPITKEDLRLFKHLSNCFQPNHRSSAVDYWTSIPLPMQTMGRHYVTWKNASSAALQGAFHLNESMRDAFREPDTWPHPRMRAMNELVTTEQLATPWLPPSAPRWRLAGRWSKPATTPRKALVFSRFRAVPQAIAALMSYGVESSLLARDGVSYDKAIKQRWFTAGQNRQATLGLFHPSPFLVQHTDPFAQPVDTASQARQLVRRQLAAALESVEVAVVKSAPYRPLWKILSQLDERLEASGWTSRAWWDLQKKVGTAESEDSGLSQLIADWDDASVEPLTEINRSQFKELADHAFSSPGVIVGRSLYRHWKEATCQEGFLATLTASWMGIRNYLDQRWFYASIRKKKEKYPDAVRRATIDGNLEAVLDEHLWITSRLRGIEGSELADELRNGFAIRSGGFHFHPVDKDRDDTFQLRCHAALPFIQERVATLDNEDKSMRTDDLRRAFNTPFWPYVLTTTSVGQEGLDFHAWCDTIVHWDLCRNPADLEQREGRIQRFGGSSIRRAIVQNLKAMKNLQVDGSSPGQSPWDEIAKLAEENLNDESGLAPWWVCAGGGINRYVFDVPMSEQNHWLHWMQEQRLLYRLALGQPNQEDLLEVLASKGATAATDVRDAVINLSPWFGGHDKLVGKRRTDQ